MGKNGYLKKCCVPNCYNVKHYNRHTTGEDKANHNYSFRLFKFPLKDQKRCKKWLKLIGLPEMVIKTNTRICSEHFTKEDYFADKNIRMDDCSVGRRCLKGTAMPSKWLPEDKQVETEGMEVDDDEKEPCLICGGEIKGGERKRRQYKFDGGENLKLLNEQLWTTFILREVLKMKEDTYGEILGMVGGSVQPGKWFVICEDCETSVVKILGFRKAIRKLEENINEMEEILKIRLEKSLDDKKEEDDGDGMDEILNVRREIRKCLMQKNGLSGGIKKEEVEKVEIKKERTEDKLIDKLNFDFDELNDDWLTASPEESEERVKIMEENEKDKQDDQDNNQSDDSEYKPEVKKKSGSQLKRKQFKRQLKVNPPTPKYKRKSKAKPKPSCDLCSYKAWSPLKMERHIIEHKIFDNSMDPSISTTQFYCNLCPTSPSPSLFLTRRHLMRHKRINHAAQLNLPIFQCPVCPESFFFKAYYSNHVFKNHPTHYNTTLSTNDNPPPVQETYLCDKCNYSTLIKDQFTRHLTHAHTSVPFICQFCSSTFKYPHSLEKHIKRFHPEKFTGRRKRNILSSDHVLQDNQLQKEIKKQKAVTCNYCSSQFPHKLALGLHLKDSHKDLFKWQCNLCEKSYLRSQSLQTHLKINHLESGVKGKCEWCGKEVQHKTYLFSHWKICTKRPPNGATIK